MHEHVILVSVHSAIKTAEFDEVSIFRLERLVCQQAVNGLADVNQRLGLFTNILHVGTPFDREISREGSIHSLTRCLGLENQAHLVSV